MRGSALVAAVGLIALVSSGACANPPERVSSPRPAAERQYIADARAAILMFEERNAAFILALRQTYTTNEALFAALDRAGAGTAFEPGLAALEALEPPASLADDHALLLDRQRALVLIDRDIGSAVRDGDLGRFVLLNTRLGLTSLRDLHELDIDLCETLAGDYFVDHPTQSAATLAEALCDRSPAPGGAYGEAVRDILRDLMIEVSERSGALEFFDLVPVIPEDERREVGNEILAELLGVLDDAARSIRALDPPDDLAQGHEQLLAYLAGAEDLLDGRVRAALADDPDAFQAPELADLYCETRATLDPAIHAIVRAHFADHFGLCPGAGEF